ncbi:Apc13p protein-domain-containing protein [Chaetomium fimeti]|uniref:Apc13p protein-domain-containing protein n=1 Tax=Chaetomium fimeti TaxID=1854472 RepID=A0AAE0LTT8_9PEZI|nr:Apc13p protein-domain-containing protein [Chaetomium fimeti]
MEATNGSRSSDSSRSLTPPQSRIPLSSSMSLTATSAADDDEPFQNTILPDSFFRAPIPSTRQNKDACFTQVHMHRSQHADLFEEFCKDRLPKDDVLVPPDLQPVNPEEEDDVVPDQHAAYGVQKATQRAREPAWKDLGLSELMARGPVAGVAPKRRLGGKRRGGGAGAGAGVGAGGGAAGGGGQYQGLPR